MKNLFFASILSLLFISPAQSQTVYENYKDGKIFFKLKEDQAIKVYENGLLNLEEFPFLLDLKNEYQLRNVYQLFFATTSPLLHRTFRLEFGEFHLADELVRTLEQIPAIEYAEKEVLHKTLATANDPQFNASYNWHLFHIHAAEAWDYAKGDKNIIVAVCDNAVYLNHQEINANLWTNTGEIPNNGIDDDGNGFKDDVHGFDFGNNDGDPSPPNVNDLNWSHGTHVSSIAAGVTNNGKQNASISYNVSLMACRGTDNSGQYVNEFPMVTYAADNGARVINMSWGAPNFNTTGKNAIDYAASKGALLIGAAGNHGNSSKFYPAGFDNVVAVANTNTTDKKYSSSAYGTWVELSAPGYSINGAATDGPAGAGNATGTSQAAPLVSGLAALMLSFNPSLTATEVKNILKTTAVNIDAQNPGLAGQMGTGRIDAEAAMKEVAKTISILDVGISGVVSPEEFVCTTGSITPELTLTNFGSVALTSATINYQIDGGTVKTKSWSGNLAGFSATTVQLDPETFSAGPHTISANTTSPNGTTDENTANDAHTGNVQLYNSVGNPIPYTEDFSLSGFPYNEWYVTDPGNGNSWKHATNAGVSGSTSVSIGNFNNDAGLVYDLVLPNFDMTTMPSPMLKFQLAYAQKNSSSSDNLKVMVSINCGSSWVTRFNKSGSSLATSSIKSTPFTPTTNDWTEQSVNLLSYASRKNLLVKLQFTGGGGNNIYVDDINLSGIVGIEDPNEATNFAIYPNPANDKVSFTGISDQDQVELYDLSGKLLTSEIISGSKNWLDLQAYSPGIYMIRMISGDNQISRRLVITE